MELIVASILTLFLNKEEGNKILACFLILYIISLEVVLTFKTLVFQDYINFYSISTGVLCMGLYVYTKRDYLHKLLVLSVVIPHIYYLLILYKPYLLSPHIPIWWLLNVDSLFVYGVFFILYEQRNDFNFRQMKFRELIINIAILMILVLF